MHASGPHTVKHGNSVFSFSPRYTYSNRSHDAQIARTMAFAKLSNLKACGKRLRRNADPWPVARDCVKADTSAVVRPEPVSRRHDVIVTASSHNHRHALVSFLEYYTRCGIGVRLVVYDLDSDGFELTDPRFELRRFQWDHRQDQAALTVLAWKHHVHGTCTRQVVPLIVHVEGVRVPCAGSV